MQFSIIIPVYNTEKYLTKCLESVLKQNFEDYEILVVNDGSTDSSKDILKEFQRKNSKIKIFNQLNRGLGGARNTGIVNAQGEYLLFLDSDDYLAENAIYILDKYIRRNNPDILAFDCNLTDVNDNIIQRATVKEYNSKYTMLTSQQFLMLEPTSCTKIFKKMLFIDYNILFPEKLWYEDLATVFRIAPLTEKIGYLKEPLYYYVQHEKSITHSANIKRMMEIKTAFDINIEYYKQNNYMDMYYKELEWNCVLHVLYYSAFRLFCNGYHEKEMKQLFDYVGMNFPEWKKNKYLLNRKTAYDMMEKVIGKHFISFYLKTGFSIKYINWVINMLKKI